MTKPPYASNQGSDNELDIIVDKTTYKFNVDGKQYAGEKKFPTSALAKIRAWLRRPDTITGMNDSDLKNTLASSAGTIATYVTITDGVPAVGGGTIVPGVPSINPGTAPITKAGEGIADAASTFTGWADALVHLVEALFDPAFWLRVLEIGIGAIAVGIGLSHLSTNAGDTLRKIPAYGKAMPK